MKHVFVLCEFASKGMMKPNTTNNNEREVARATMEMITKTNRWDEWETT